MSNKFKKSARYIKLLIPSTFYIKFSHANLIARKTIQSMKINYYPFYSLKLSSNVLLNLIII